MPETTRVTFHNPVKKQVSEAYDGNEYLAGEHFLSALLLKGPTSSADTDRTVALGECASALVHVMYSGDMDYLLSVCNDLLETHAEIEHGRVVVIDSLTGDIILPEEIA